MIKFKAKTKTGEIINSALSPFQFPAGEAHIKREDRRELEAIEIAIVQPSADSLHDDLFKLLMWSNYLYNTPGQFKQVAVIPYFPGARADRGLPYGAGEYAQFIYGTAIDQVIIYDPHSETIVNELNYDPEFLKVTAVKPHEVLNTRDSKIVMPNNYDGIIAPDKGAVDRASAVAEVLQVPVYLAEKKRDFESGFLTGFAIEDSFPDNGSYLIVDDICDGGGTFIGLANAIKEKAPDVQLNLYVSHGVFSKDALKKLDAVFGRVFTTNSYDPTRPLTTRETEFQDECDTFHRIDVIRTLLDRIDV